MFGSLGFTELLVILVIVLILFGGKKIPTLARDIGSGIREFRRSLGDSFQSLRSLPETLETGNLESEQEFSESRKSIKKKRTKKKNSTRAKVRSASRTKFSSTVKKKTTARNIRQKKKATRA